MQTPAPKRRFLRDQPSSASSSTPHQQQASSAKTPFRFTGASQNPLSTQRTPFRTPRTTYEPDGLDTSFEDDGSQKPLGRAVTRHPGGGNELQEESGIEDEDEEENVAKHRTTERDRRLGDYEETNVDFDAVSRRQDGSTINRNAAHSHDTSVSDLKPSKRPKLTVSNRSLEEEVSSTSSASDDEDVDMEHHATGKKKGLNVPPARSDHPSRERIDTSPSEDDEPQSPTQRSPTITRHYLTPHPPPPPATRSTHRPFLKPSNPPTGPEPLPLPDTFSPSRRRGRHEYVPGGAAATVRSWILGIAAVETPDSLNQGQTITVKSLTRDRGGRCVRVMDETGREWVLVGQPPGRGWRGGGRAETDLERLQEGYVVKIKGTATHWAIPGFASGEVDAQGGVKDMAGDLHVAVLWDIVSS